MIQDEEMDEDLDFEDNEAVWEVFIGSEDRYEALFASLIEFADQKGIDIEDYGFSVDNMRALLAMILNRNSSIAANTFRDEIFMPRAGLIKEFFIRNMYRYRDLFVQNIPFRSIIDRWNISFIPPAPNVDLEANLRVYTAKVDNVNMLFNNPDSVKPVLKNLFSLLLPTAREIYNLYPSLASRMTSEISVKILCKIGFRPMDDPGANPRWVSKTAEINNYIALQGQGEAALYTGEVDNPRFRYNRMFALLLDTIGDILIQLNQVRGTGMGSDPIEETDIISSVMVYAYFKSEVAAIEGGCATRRKRETLKLHQMTIIHSSPKTRGNNCGLACMAMFFQELKRNSYFCGKLNQNVDHFAFRQPRFWRRDILKRKDSFMLTINDLMKVGTFFGLSITVYDDEMIPLEQNLLPHGFAHINLLVRDSHFSLIEKIKIDQHEEKFFCPICNRNTMGAHVCSQKNFLDSLRLVQNDYKKLYMSSLENDGKEASINLLDQILSKLIIEKQHILLHAPAGFGKSYLISQLVERWKHDEQSFLVTASTGIAASMIGGRTVHSALQLYNKKPTIAFVKYLRQLQFLVIDEISMIDARTFAKIDLHLRLHRDNNLPFGGVQLILSGDCLQLPPVSNSKTTFFFFQSYIFRKMFRSLFIPRFLHNYRQKNDIVFHRILEHAREGKLSKEDVAVLETRKVQPPNETPHFFPHRQSVKAYNTLQLSKLEGDIITILAKDDSTRVADKSFVLEKELKLKKNAFLIVCRNLDQQNLFNGSFCSFQSYDASEDVIWIRDTNNVLIKIQRYKEQVNVYGVNRIRLQFPVRLAWALTIHKCQGMTLERACIDIGSDVFSEGQTYVALSRVPCLEALYIAAFNPQKVFVNRAALSFDKLAKSADPDMDSLFESSSDEMLCSDPYSMSGTNIEVSLKKTSKSFLNKVIFYDFETLDTRSNAGIQPYFNYIRYIQNGVLREEKTFILHENSDDVMNDTFDSIINWALEDDARTESLIDKGSYASRNARRAPIYLCAYNGANFDFHWLFQYLLQSRLYPSTIYSKHIFKGSSIVFLQIISATSGRVILQTHDICQILTSTLQNAVFDFCGSKMKGVFPHLWVQKNGAQALIDAKNSLLTLTMDDFYHGQHKEVENAINEGQITLCNYDIYHELVVYGKQDVIILQKLYEAVNIISQDLFSCNIYDFITASSMAFYGFAQHVPKQVLLKTNKKQRTLNIFRLNKKEEDFVRSAVYGGRTIPRIHEWVSSDIGKANYNEIEDYYVYLDISGMYVAAMKEQAYPIGPHNWLTSELDQEQLDELAMKLNTNRFTKATLPFFIAEVDIVFNVNDLEPSSPYRQIHPSSKTPLLMWGVERQEQSVYSSVLLQRLCRNGARIVKMKRCMLWSAQSKIFEKWMDFTLNVKNSGGSAKRKFGKILGNGTYGSMMKHDHSEVVRIVETQEQMDKFHRLFEWTDLIPAFKKMIIKGKPLNEDKKDVLCSRPIFLAVFILDYTKCMVDDFIQKLMPNRFNVNGIFEQPLYGDTDSLVVHASLLKNVEELLGKENGFWSDELLDAWDYPTRTFGKIVEWIGTAPKSYGLQYRLPTDNVLHSKVKFKGIPRSGISFEWKGSMAHEITLDILRECIQQNISLEITIADRIKKHKFNLSQKEKTQGVHVFSLSCINMKRTIFKTNIQRRKMLNDRDFNSLNLIKPNQFPGRYKGITVPMGYINKF